MKGGLPRSLVAVVLFATAATGCGGGTVPIELSSDERAYLIPNSSDWGEGNPCEDADCPGELTVETMHTYCWVEIDPTSWSADAAGTEPSGLVDGFFEVMMVLRGPPDDVVLGQLSPSMVEPMQQASDAGHRLVLGVGCADDPMKETLVFEAIAIDEEGRFAGLGFGAALLTSTPLARAAAADGAPSGEWHLHAVLRSQ